MPCLGILNLSETDIEFLPDSIIELKNLTTLLLHRCFNLRHLPCLSKLQGLKKLDLYWTRIEEVPEGMDMLVDLRYLDLENTNLKDIPAGLLSKLSHIQHLKIDLSIAKASVEEELMTLENLECFEGSLKDRHDFDKFVSAMQQSKKNLINYRLQVGPRFTPYDYFRAGKSVLMGEYKFCEGELFMLPLDVQELEIFSCQDLRSLNHAFPSLENAIDLRVCRIAYCKEIECVASWSSSTHPFQSLDRLHLFNLPKLRQVIKVERSGSTITSRLPPSPTFSLLKVIYIRNCLSIKTLLPHWLLPG
ncbi:hypothetical protein V6N13_016593 [Hibiscus sabdariffa]